MGPQALQVKSPSGIIRPPLLEEPSSRFSDHENLFLNSVPFMPTLSHSHEHEKLDMPKRARVPG